MPPNEPRIIPPDRRLLGATLDNRRPILGEPTQLPDPYREGSTAEGASIDGAPIEPPIATGRRLTIYYQSQGATNGFIQNTPAVAPEIDQGIDIAKPVLNQFVKYTNDRSQINPIPITGLPIQKVGYGNTQDPNQQKHINSLQEAKTIFENTTETFVRELDSSIRGGTDPRIVTTDPLGVYNKDGKSPRSLRLSNYQKGINTGNTGTEEHKNNIDQMLYETRGFYDILQFSAVDTTVTPDKKDNRITLGSYFYKELGNYASGSYVRRKPQTDPDGKLSKMTLDQMKNIGLNIMFEAAQGQAGFDFTIRNDDPTATASAEARMTLPSEQRLGKRVSLGRFTPAYQIKKLTGYTKPSSQNFIDNTDDIQSYGSFYNVFNQFDALVPLGQIALCVALILAFTSTLSLLAGILQLQTGVKPTAYVDLDNKDKQNLKGTSVLQDNPVFPSVDVGAGAFFTQFLGTATTFNNTKHTWTQCLTAGIQEFFGFAFLANTGTPVGTQAVNASLKVLTESGRLNVILRELLRSGITLVESNLYDPSQLASVTGASNLIKKIRDLKIVRFINVLLVIGDRVRFEQDLHEQAQTNIVLAGGSYGFGASGSVSLIDSLPEGRPFFISKSRRTNSREIIWNNKSAGMQLLPLFVGQGNSQPNPNSFGYSGYTPGSSHWQDMGLTVRGIGDGTETISDLGTEQRARQEKQKAIQNDRWSADVVKEIEQTLEADFMPFYIHDLRTNEILSFHAFLEDASEDFNVEYSAQEGYGRMDKVQIYKGTTRNISVNFKMVAMNEDDHDVMWYKVNRLAMMIYPQWTQGRKVSVGENIKFIQPFSQIPGATPVVRLRLGDLYKSNYSKMAVARLFGITTLGDEYNVLGQISNGQNSVSSTAPAPGATPAPESAAIDETFTPEAIRRLRSGQEFGSVSRNRPNANRQRSAASSTSTIRPEDCFVPDQTIVLKTGPGLSDMRQQTKFADGSKIPTPTQDPNGRIIAIFKNSDNREIVVKPVLYKSGNNTPAPILLDLPSIRGAIERASGGRELQASGGIVQLEEQGRLDFIYPIEILNDILDREKTATLMEQTQRNQAQQQAQTPQATNANEVPDRAQTTQPPTQPQQIQNFLTPQNFYDETKNPIMKAFRSSGGKGLAGVITSFKIDYGEAKGSWGTNGNDFLRAPKFVTINLQMAVIHDITPGLDARGIMNAPIWPVGKRSNFFVNNGPEPEVGGTTPVSGQPSSNKIADNSYFDPTNRVVYVPVKK